MKDNTQLDILVKGGTFITMDATRRILNGGAVGIKGEKIEKVFPDAQSIGPYTAKETIHAEGKVIIPGLINAHGHMAMTLFRGFVEDLQLYQWLEKVWKYELSELNEASVRIGSKLAIAEMIRSGVSCAHDMYWHYMATIDLGEELGFQIISGPPITGIGEPDFNEMIQRAKEVLNKIKTYKNVYPIIQAHSTYTTTPEMMHHVKAFKDEFGVGFTTHASENQTEVNDVGERYKKTPIELLDSYGLLDERTVLAHCVKLRDDEIELLSHTKTNVVHCPESNLKLGSGIARIADMIDAGINVCIGTDGAASNNDLDLLGEVRTAALLQKGLTENPEKLTTLEAMEMATVNGARAFGFLHERGSIEEGKLADLAIINFNKSHLTPCHDIYAHLIYSVNKADVESLFIRGKLQLYKGELTTIDEEKLIAEARAIGEVFYE